MGKKKNKPTQCMRILDYIDRFGFITSWQAYTDLGITQLAARIYNLKEQGYEFETKRVVVQNRFGEPTHYDEYRLKNNA